MPRIYDNLELHLAPELCTALVGARSADFCVGYFNLRGWGVLEDAVEALPPGGPPVRVLVGMHRPPQELRRALHGAGGGDEAVDQQRAIRARRLKRLESSGAAFLRSVERHVLRNHVFLEALRAGRLCFTPEQADAGVREPVIVCSMGIR